MAGPPSWSSAKAPLEESRGRPEVSAPKPALSLSVCHPPRSCTGQSEHGPRPWHGFFLNFVGTREDRVSLGADFPVGGRVLSAVLSERGLQAPSGRRPVETQESVGSFHGLPPAGQRCGVNAARRLC